MVEKSSDPNKTAHQPNVTKVFVSSAALERLIGGDSELEINLRRQIAENFAKHHLKALVTTDVFRKALQEIKVNVEAEVNKAGIELVRKRIGNMADASTWNPPRISPAFMEELRKTVDTMAMETLEGARRQISQYFEERVQQFEKDFEGWIQLRINQVTNEMVEEKVREGIERRLRAAAEMSE